MVDLCSELVNVAGGSDDCKADGGGNVFVAHRCCFNDRLKCFAIELGEDWVLISRRRPAFGAHWLLSFLSETRVRRVGHSVVD